MTEFFLGKRECFSVLNDGKVVGGAKIPRGEDPGEQVSQTWVALAGLGLGLGETIPQTETLSKL